MSSSDITLKSISSPMLPVRPANSSPVIAEEPGSHAIEKGKDLPLVVPAEEHVKTSKSEETDVNATLDNAVENINKFVKNNRREIQFSVDDQTGRHVVKVIDFQSKELIRQIPAEEVLEIARRLDALAEEKGNIIQTSA